MNIIYYIYMYTYIYIMFSFMVIFHVTIELQEDK